MTPMTRRWTTAPWIVLVVSLLVTAAATWAALATVNGRLHARFQSSVQSTRDRIQGRLDTYVAVLQATAGLFAASSDVSEDEFRAYAARLRLRERYPGIQGIGYSRRVMPSAVPALERAMHAEGDRTFHVWPEGARSEYHTILYLEPRDRRNAAAIGYDMFTDATRREAMSRARDAAAPAMSGRVQLVQEIDERKQAGFLIYVPIYQGRDVPSTPEARRAGLAGFVYAPFRADDLFEGLFRGDIESRVAFQLYDGNRARPDLLLHDSRTERDARGQLPASGLYVAAHSDTVRLVNAGRSWTLVFTPTTALLDNAGRGMVPLVAVVGAMVSLLLFLLTRAYVREREREWHSTRETAALASQVQARNAELAAASRLKSEFLATMSHEIRTPLNAILGYTQLMDMELSGPVTPEQRAQLSRITSSGQHLLALIDDILDLSRIEADRLTVAHLPARAESSIEAALALLRPQAAAKHITLLSRCDDPDLRYVGDEQRVQQILTNLLTNAVKFTPATGRVTLYCQSASQLPVGAEATERGPWIRFLVEDTGIGIAPAQQQRVFQPFVQGDSGYTRAHGGAGLGLTISRRLARLMGGDLTLESTEGLGSRFTLWLPAAGTVPAVPRPERALAERP